MVESEIANREWTAEEDAFNDEKLCMPGLFDYKDGKRK